jgi:hypothetical protein
LKIRQVFYTKSRPRERKNIPDLFEQANLRKLLKLIQRRNLSHVTPWLNFQTSLSEIFVTRIVTGMDFFFTSALLIILTPVFCRSNLSCPLLLAEDQMIVFYKYVPTSNVHLIIRSWEATLTLPVGGYLIIYLHYSWRGDSLE